MILKTAFAIFSTLILSCGTAEKQTQTNTTSQTTSETTSTTVTTTNNEIMNSQKMMADGFKLGTIEYSDKEDDCPYTIKMVDDNKESYYLDPTNLEENYKKDGQKVWIKFNGLRRMNRCDKANPVELVDIKKGE